jgi:hypothetical protein
MTGAFPIGDPLTPAPEHRSELNRGCIHGSYSPEANAHFLFVAGDSRDNGAMWVYRYKRATDGG